MSSTLQLTVRGMHCGSCALLIDDALAGLPGVIDSRTSTRAGRSTVTHDHRTAEFEIIAAIEELGYRAEPAVG
ncbi:copper chaperone CopZ [Pseudonocardia sediminis]|uniref:Copper chaperone CopZ n=1 Tax=Pseudonocardia sediminis TaxID=1397368 RepID=A0A4Q7UWX9_PSEST|nr:heavy metal-associated domain-containing protein [Pseudonocardia sediminis]RZT85594.1 copper chaperone CopZ [Pseudonocardia sediminis]